MSEFRIFCFGGFIGEGFFATMDNHGWVYSEVHHNSAAMIACGLFFAFAGVMLFGRKASS